MEGGSVIAVLSAILTIIGVAIATVGSFLTLWTIIRDGKKKDSFPHGTFGWLANIREEFPKEQKKAIIGCVMIVIGGVLQVAGQVVMFLPN